MRPKAVVRNILKSRDRTAFLDWALNKGNFAGTLTSLLFDSDDLISFRAIEAFGWISAKKAETDLESVREIIRRMLWGMNDESGICLWRAPEVIGEILVNVPELIPEYANILAEHMNEEPFERGTYSAMARVARIKPGVYSAYSGELRKSLGNKDPYIRASAVKILNNLNSSSGKAEIAKLIGDKTMVRVYNFTNGKFDEITIGDLAETYIAG